MTTCSARATSFERQWPVSFKAPSRLQIGFQSEEWQHLYFAAISYRFPLAHEAGHVVLHTELFKQQRFRRVDDWKDFVRTFPELDLSRLEWQAHSFAGLVLVPADALERVIREVIRQVKAQGVNRVKRISTNTSQS